MALFALAIQVALCFSHIHAGDFSLTTAKAAQAAQADGGAQATGKNAPIDQSDRSDSGCPICALIQLAATSTPSLAPALAPPERLAPFTLQAPDEFALVGFLHFSFQARAPPAA